MFGSDQTVGDLFQGQQLPSFLDASRACRVYRVSVITNRVDLYEALILVNRRRTCERQLSVSILSSESC